ncbi:alpha/beta fold hydrolase [Mycobacterium sp.]|uniref:alpha/beta fold hydrolase n=1 Tax=Mycobacterium sp. TaxID=1785 RepID=UPI0031CF5A36
MTQSIISARGMDFTVRRAGQAGEPVLLLHGFPETSAMWSAVMASLVGEGYRCAAPDQRGYSPGARPREVQAYRHEELVGDVVALADALGFSRFHLVAHDWGAAIAWLVAIAAPSRLASLTVLSIPHYHAFAEATWTDPDVEDYRRFLGLVLAPDGAAERVLGQDQLAAFRALLTHHSAAEHEQLVAVLDQPGALSAALAWYRASDGHRRMLSAAAEPVAVPTLLIMGRDEPYAGPLAVALGEAIPIADYRRVDLDAGHWLVQERPAEVTRAIIEQLRGYPIP